jgi:FtsP/CotA-like multicopper oxidase with cupredoxin domain
VVQNTRIYNGDIAAPTIRITPGTTTTTVNVNLVNNLPAPLFSTASLHNQYRSPDITNLHSARRR